MSAWGQIRPFCDVRSMSGSPPKAAVQRTWVDGANVPKCMARPRGARRISESDERESCINVSGLFVEHLLLRTIMGIRAHPG